ncbi:hAT transposon superfamily protein [Zea mays]|uniref:HAT transposon superfamily protein n=1 Tax=Zea mays TaxID=4577 RepID=A0A1D6MPF7_MAIZE|nr:hAT transposon superfamily protein [Zea mays]AQK84994.1 hAT transposon superfamily protein [Zea mays]ONM30933.1 hAT transposon superfamily protein [Zea mays]
MLVVTDNASNNMGAKKLLLEKRPQIFWTSCAAHTINLMLQGIGKLPRFRKVIDQAFWKDVKLMLAVFEPLVKVLRLVDGDVKPSMGFLYGELLKAKREIKEAFGNVESRFKDVMAVIEKKMNGRLDSPLHLTAFLLNPHYSYANPSIFDEPKMNEAFISCVEQFYYHDEDQQEQAANFELKKFQNREGPFSKKLARTFQNYDYNPGRASWWRLYGTETPALQKMATRILSLTSSSSGCERNWSGFEGIHTKKRNRLTTTRLNKLVYIQFNNRLMNNREKIKSKKITDVLLSSDTTEAQGFLQEGGDDCAQVVFRDEEEDEMEGTGIPWSVIGEAVGAEEQLEPRRSARVRELYEGEEFESEEEEYEDEDLCYSEDEI